MRLVVANHRYWPFSGGSERYAQAVAESFAADGAHVRVVTSDAYDLEYFWDRRRRAVDAPDLEWHNGVEIARVPVRHYPLSSFAFRGTHRLMGEASRVARVAPPYALAARALPWLPGFEAALAGAGPADVIFASNLGLEGLALAALRVARRSGAAFVLAPFTHLGDARDQVARRFVTMPHQLRLLRAADALVAMTALEARFLASVGVARGRIVVAGAGFHPEDVTGGDGVRFRERHATHGPLVGALGALAREKGTFELVRAVALLRSEGRAVDLALAGPSLGGFERWFTRLSPRERAGTQVLGVIDDDDRRDMLSAMDVLALPSRTESFGIVFVEAWANAKPVVGAAAGAIPDLVRDGENGLLVPYGDPAALARAVARILDDPDMASRLGWAGRELALGSFQWPSVIERLRAAFEIALGYPVATLREVG